MTLTDEQKIYCERTRQLVRVLTEVHRDNRPFTLYYWATSYPSIIAELIAGGDLPEGTCGTAACAVGYAGLDPWFRAQGFKLSMCQGNVTSGADWEVEYTTPEQFMEQGAEGEILQDWEAIGQFFSMPVKTATSLFLPENYDADYTAETVIDRLNAYICNTYGPEHEMVII